MPTYAAIGALAPAILVVARMMQGLSLGGEYGASATYLSEMAGPQAARLLFQLPICHPDRRPADRARGAARAAIRDVRGGSRGVGLADPVRDRRGAGGGRVLHPPPARRDRELRESPGPSGAPRSSGVNLFRDHPEGGVAGHGADRRRHLGLLRLHHLHAEIPGQHLGLRPRDGEPGDDRRLVPVHVPSAARRRAVGPGRAQAGDGRPSACSA